MRRSVLWTIVLCAVLVACGDEKPPALFAPDDDAGDPDAGGSGSGGDSGVAGQDGGVLAGDLCKDHLSGLSCQVQQITAGRSFTCALFEDGRVKCWGRWNGTIGDGPGEMGDDLAFVDFGTPIIQIEAGESELAALGEDGRVYTALFVTDGLARQGTVAFPDTDEVISLGGPTCALLSTGRVKCWHWLSDWPNGFYFEITVPAGAAVADGFSAAQVTQASLAPGGFALDGMGLFTPFNTCALDAAGKVLCWGNNAAGQLGEAVGPLLPATDLPLLDVGGAAATVAPGRGHSCAIMEQGSQLKCWGSNLFGQLGQNTTSGGSVSANPPPSAPTVVLGPIAQVVLGGDFTCTLSSAGATYCFGASNYGQLGRGSKSTFGGAVGHISPNTAPVDLGTGRRAVQLASGEIHACALLDDHSVKCWGNGQGGALGLGDPNDRGDDPNEMGDALPRVDLGILTADAISARSPTVSVVAPVPSLDPATDPIHTGNTLVVQCGATASVETMRPVNSSSVRVRVHSGSASGPTVAEATAAMTGAGTYTATVLGLASFASGSYWVECVAADDQDPPTEGRATTQILHDGGPTLRFIAPTEDQVVGQSSLLHIEVEISAAELGPVDPDAAVTSYQLTVAGVVVPLIQSTTDPDRYSADVDFLSMQFQPAPVGNILLIATATNTRGAVATLQQSALVDGTGPMITVQGSNHDNGRLIRGAQAMFVTLTDVPAGVDASGAFGRIGSFTFPFVRQTGDTYRGVFDSLRFDRTVSQLTVEVHAFDIVGNETVLTRTLQLDNQPPLVSLDPPNIREYKANGSNPDLCSTPFDPVGSDSASDGDIVPEGAELRARIEDETNGLEGFGVLTYLALVDPTRVRVYMQGDPTAPILIDTDGDNECDEINNEAAAYMRDLKPIPPAGASYYPASAATDGLQPTWTACSAGTAAVAPATLCAATSPLTRVIKAPVLGTPVAAIYGLSVVNSVACVGDSWDWRLQFPNGGPVCAVARAEDTLGNVGVSPPIRICLQRSDGIGFDCSADLSWQNRDCLSGDHGGDQVTCTAPPDYPLEYVREDNL